MADRDHDILRARPTGAQPDHTPIAPVTLPLHDRFSDWDAQLARLEPVEPAPPPRRHTGRWRWFLRGLAAFLVLLIVAIGWLAITAPLSKSLEPPTPPSITLTAADGTPIARRGALLGPPVDARDLPPHVVQAFLAIEDRRFYSHWGIDPHGVARAAWHNLRGGGVREGGSTITQQLAKNASLDSDRTAGRKIREAMIALWLEAWLTKDQILSRYLSNVYFGDNVYGLSAASKHYFGRKPADLSIGQAAMLAGLVKAPSKLAPTGNLDGAQAREMVVVNAMVAAHFLTKDEADDVRPQNVLSREPEQLPSGTYFADWVMPGARDEAGEIKTKATVATTLDPKLQHMAERAVRNAGLRRAQVALVAMRPDGRVVAMVGGKDYGKSPFNRATQARRQPGSTFKLFVYLAAMRAGMTPDSKVLDKPVTIGDWKPHNADGRYEGEITLRQAFARSSNVAAARLTQKVGVKAVIQAARDLGISTPIPNEATIGLGSSSVSLLELTAAFAAVADDRYPVQARGLQDERQKSWYQSLTGGATTMPANIHSEMLDLLGASIRTGTGRQANLPIDAFGKTGTTSDSKDALFVGFAKDLVVGVWVGNDDNTPNPGLSGGGIPARVWRAFMTDALGLRPVIAPVDDAVDPDAIPPDDVGNLIERTIGGAVDDVVQRATEKVRGLDLRMGNDGSIVLRGNRDRPPPPADDQRGPPERARPEE
ncbi:transglycosylase domain-containing protein [uncultured Sphingomonas sp.]|uniref:transglycosylase domain-containing protein n=1 Tax=uncultured Sphingomonas sp. TaxID=158754 RepID=UPI0035CA4673